jgi:hypothetical protein
MARLACSASLSSLVDMSSGMRVSLMRFNPSDDFWLTKAPILSNPVAG